jgi:hypothetical protein
LLPYCSRFGYGYGNKELKIGFIRCPIMCPKTIFPVLQFMSAIVFERGDSFTISENI